MVQRPDTLSRTSGVSECEKVYNKCSQDLNFFFQNIISSIGQTPRIWIWILLCFYIPKLIFILFLSLLTFSFGL